MNPSCPGITQITTRLFLVLFTFCAWPTAMACGQSSLITARKMIDMKLVALLRNMSEELDDGTGQSKRLLMHVLCYQINLGEIDAAIETLSRATVKGNSKRLDWNVINGIEELIENPLYGVAFFERPELAKYPDLESALKHCRVNAMASLVQREQAPFPQALAMLNSMGQPDDCVTGKGENESFASWDLRYVWDNYMTARARAGDLKWVTAKIRDVKSNLVRNELIDAVINGVAAGDDAPGKLDALSHLWQDELLHNKTQRRRAHALIAEKRFSEAANELTALDTSDSKSAIKLACDIAKQLFDAGELKLAATVAEHAVPLFRQSGDRSDNLYEEATRQLQKAILLMFSGEADESLAEAAAAFSLLDSVSLEEGNEDDFELADSLRSEFVIVATRYLVAVEDFERVDRLLEIVINDVARAVSALESLRLIHKNDIMMYEDRAFRKFLLSLARIEDADARSSIAHDLATNDEIRKTNEQCLELFQIGKTGYYRYEIVAEVFGRMDFANVSSDVIQAWIAETESLVTGEDDDPYTAWQSLISGMAGAGKLDGALSHLENHVSIDYQGYLACILLRKIYDIDQEQNDSGEKLSKVIEFLADHPDIQFVAHIGDVGEGQLPTHFPKELFDLTWKQMQSLDPQTCYPRAMLARNFDLDLFDLEKLYAPVQTMAYLEYTNSSILNALKNLGEEQFISQVARLKLPWFRNVCESVLNEKRAQTDFAFGMLYVVAATNGKERLKRFQVLWNHY